jgi:hypothetical protein
VRPLLAATVVLALLTIVPGPDMAVVLIGFAVLLAESG